MKKTGLADSPFFAATPQTLAPVREEQAIFSQSERNTERTEIRSEKRTVELPTKRRTTRYSFEFYEDQLMRLKQLKYQAEVEGKKVFLSDFVREAVELYLKDKGI
jgi:hypothetical protein